VTRFQGVERIVLMALARGVARIERSEIRGRRRGGVSPGFATLNPGYIRPSAQPSSFSRGAAPPRLAVSPLAQSRGGRSAGRRPTKSPRLGAAHPLRSGCPPSGAPPRRFVARTVASATGRGLRFRIPLSAGFVMKIFGV